MVGILIIAAAMAPAVWVIGVWGHRVFSGEYRRLWRPFERALKTGQRPVDIAPAEWAEFIAARRRGHRRALIAQSLLLALYIPFELALHVSMTPYRLANIALAVFLVVSLGTRLRQIDRLTHWVNG